MIEFNVGSKVMLKSGGPVMEVIQVIGDKRICQWEGQGDQDGEFNVATLKRVED